MCDNKEEKDMEALAKIPTRRPLKNKKNVIKPKVQDGKLLFDRNNPLHKYIYGEDK